MNISDKMKFILRNILIAIGLLSSCVYDEKYIACFKNCTEDTLYIGLSQYNCFDSVKTLLYPDYKIIANSDVDTTDISLWKGDYFKKNYFVYPDSLCSIDYPILFEKSDTGYIYMLKWKDAKKYSWDEIRFRKLFHKCIIVRDKDGKYNGDLRYSE